MSEPVKKYRVLRENVELSRKEGLAKKAAILDSYDESIQTLEQEICELRMEKNRQARKASPKTCVKYTKVFEGDDGYDDLDDSFCPAFYQGDLKWINERTEYEDSSSSRL